MTDQLASNVLTVQPDGTIGATFTNYINAPGIQDPASVSVAAGPKTAKLLDANGRSDYIQSGQQVQAVERWGYKVITWPGGANAVNDPTPVTLPGPLTVFYVVLTTVFINAAAYSWANVYNQVYGASPLFYVGLSTGAAVPPAGQQTGVYWRALCIT